MLNAPRKTLRFCWFGAVLVLIFVRYAANVHFAPPHRRAGARGRWTQQSAQSLLRVFDARVRVEGTPPTEGILVCNHLSYLDILVIAAVTPARFVSKKEVERWPVFGSLARLAATVFIDRSKRTEAGASNSEIQTALQEGGLLVLFPEGTSTGGQTVLPFKSALLEPAAGGSCAISAGCLGYSMPVGDVAEEVCYWRDMTLLPHLWNLLGGRNISARIAFSAFQEGRPERKQLARLLHAAVVRLKEQAPPEQSVHEVQSPGELAFARCPAV